MDDGGGIASKFSGPVRMRIGLFVWYGYDRCVITVIPA